MRLIVFLLMTSLCPLLSTRSRPDCLPASFPSPPSNLDTWKRCRRPSAPRPGSSGLCRPGPFSTRTAVRCQPPHRRRCEMRVRQDLGSVAFTRSVVLEWALPLSGEPAAPFQGFPSSARDSYLKSLVVSGGDPLSFLASPRPSSSTQRLCSVVDFYFSSHLLH